MDIEPGRLYLTKQVAEFLQCGKSNVYDLIASKDLGCVRIGAGRQGLRVLGSDLLSFIGGRREGGRSPKGTIKRLAKYLD